MPIVRTESRSRVAIDWYDDEDEADAAGQAVKKSPGLEGANLGTVQVGRDRSFDRPGQYAVVTP